MRRLEVTNHLCLSARGPEHLALRLAEPAKPVVDFTAAYNALAGSAFYVDGATRRN